MKKMALLIAMAALVVPAFAVVTSQNIVGYYNVSGSAGEWQMVGLQLGKVGDPTGEIGINDLISGTIPYGTKIQVRQASGAYAAYTYSDEAYVAELEDYVPGWADYAGDLATDTQVIGDCFWVNTPVAATSMRVMGEVFNEDAITLTPVLVGGMAMISTPFPAGFNPNEATWGDDISYGDQLKVLLPGGGYATYTYLDEAFDAELEDFVEGWADYAGDLITKNIADLGQGFWVISSGNVKVTIPNPYK